VPEIFGLSAGKEKHDYRQGGFSKWLDKVHGIKLAKVTPARVQQWKQSFLAKAGNDPLALRRARISVNSMLRQARSLFSFRRLRHLQLSLPNPLPFDGVDFAPRQSMKYRSEIDLLEWPSFRWRENVIRIEPTRYFHPKSEDSIADLPVDPEVMTLFRGYYQRAKGSFVIESGRPPLPAKPRRYYRCEQIFEQVNQWLRKAWSKWKQAASHVAERVRSSNDLSAFRPLVHRRRALILHHVRTRGWARSPECRLEPDRQVNPSLIS
jgi:hypothetical protein